MNAIDLYIKTFQTLYSPNRRADKLLSQLRYLVRHIANKHLSTLLDKPPADTRCATRDPRVVVSLTSFPARIDSVWQVVENMKRQTVQPGKIILWLSEEQFPHADSVPRSLTDRTDDMFELRIVPGDLRSHKKYCYAFREFPDHNIILVDDDIYYPTTTVEQLLAAHARHPEAVICRYGCVPRYGADGSLLPYTEWPFCRGPHTAGNIFFGSGGGTLIVPRTMHPDVTDSCLFMRLAPTADDIWLNAMARLARTPIVKLPSGIIMEIENRRRVSLHQVNVLQHKNDEQIANVVRHYAQRGITLRM